MAFQAIGAVGMHCPLHGDRLTDLTPEISSHKVVVCDLCGTVIRTTTCRTCNWKDIRLEGKCSRCGQHFCEDCGRRASIGGYHSVELCRDCDAERIAEEREAYEEMEDSGPDPEDEDSEYQDDDDFEDDVDDFDDEEEDESEDEDDGEDEEAEEDEEDEVRNEVWRQVIRMSRLRR